MTLTTLSDSDIETIGKGLVDRTLPRAEWTHTAHFAAALWLFKAPDIDPFVDMPGYIRAYNEASGTPNTDTEGYHETITLASLKATRHALETARPDASLSLVLIALLADGYSRTNWLLTYWTKDRLFSVEARRYWVPPDLAELPF